jgi:hypothetical protein
VALGESEIILFGIAAEACVGFRASKENARAAMTTLIKTDLTLNIKNLPQEFLREEAWAKRK